MNVNHAILGKLFQELSIQNMKLFVRIFTPLFVQNPSFQIFCHLIKFQMLSQNELEPFLPFLEYDIIDIETFYSFRDTFIFYGSFINSKMEQTIANKTENQLRAYYSIEQILRKMKHEDIPAEKKVNALVSHWNDTHSLVGTSIHSSKYNILLPSLNDNTHRSEDYFEKLKSYHDEINRMTPLLGSTPPSELHTKYGFALSLCEEQIFLRLESEAEKEKIKQENLILKKQLADKEREIMNREEVIKIQVFNWENINLQVTELKQDMTVQRSQELKKQLQQANRENEKSKQQCVELLNQIKRIEYERKSIASQLTQSKNKFQAELGNPFT
jgi:hypothetical protein